MKKPHFFIISLFLVFNLSCHKGSPGKNTPVVETIDGIEYVHNPAEPLYPEKRVIFEEELTITGEDEKTGELHLFRAGVYNADKNGNVYIADNSDKAIKVFDKNGNFVKKIGREGQGPGEFKGIGSIYIFPDNRLLVKSQRFVIFDETGEFITDFKPDLLNTYIDKIYFANETSITIGTIIFDKNRQLDRKASVKNIDYKGNETIEFGKFKTNNAGYRIKTDKGYTSFFIPYIPESIFAGDIENKTLYHCLTSEYLFEVYNLEGKVFRKIDRMYTPVPISEKEKKEIIDPYKKVYPEYVKQIKLPASKPVARNLIIDDQSNLWVRTYEEKEENEKTLTTYDIFDSKGFYTMRVWLEFNPGLFKNGKMYRKHTDEETGVATIKRYDVKWIKN